MTADLLPQPRDADAERAVLGAVLLTNGTALDNLRLDADDFWTPAHAAVYTAATALHADGRPADPVTVADHLRATGHLTAIGGHAGLADLITAAPTADPAWHAHIVRTAATRRRGITALVRATQALADPAADPDTCLAAARTQLDDLAATSPDDPAGPLHDDLDHVIDHLDDPDTAQPTGWPDLDRLIGGWRPGTLNVIAARPGNGKTIACLQTAMHAARTTPVLVASLEMTRRELAARMLAATARLDLRQASRGVTPEQLARITAARDHLRDLPVDVTHHAGLTVADIRSAAHATRRTRGSLGLLVVDYLQLVRPARGHRHENRQTEVAAASRDLKALALDLDVPVLLAAQVNRAPEIAGRRKPRISDLRESGAIEADADTVCLLHHDPEEDPSVVEVTVGKNRHGPTGGLVLNWEARWSRITSRTWGAA